MTVARIVLLVVAMLPLGLFIYYYGRYSSWKSTIQGRLLMAQKIAMVAVLGASLARAVFGEYPGWEIVSIVLFGGLVTLFWAMLFALRAAQKETARTVDHLREKE